MPNVKEASLLIPVPLKEFVDPNKPTHVWQYDKELAPPQVSKSSAPLDPGVTTYTAHFSRLLRAQQTFVVAGIEISLGRGALQGGRGYSDTCLTCEVVTLAWF